MLGARQFTVDPSRIVHETIDGETILIDLETGTYYSLRGCGSEIWALLLAGWAQADVIAALQDRYPSERQAAGAATAELIAQLHDEGLLALAEPNREAADAGPAALMADTGARPYAPPVLERYTDMQYFLLLDPIHEVDEGGWPQAPSPGPGPTASRTKNG